MYDKPHERNKYICSDFKQLRYLLESPQTLHAASNFEDFKILSQMLNFC